MLKCQLVVCERLFSPIVISFYEEKTVFIKKPFLMVEGMFSEDFNIWTVTFF